jgi:hypothetical protein
MPATPSDRLGLTRPADGDFIETWPGTARAMIDNADDVMAIFSHADPRPAAGIPGRFHRHPVSSVISYDTGAAWIQIATAPVVKTFQTVHSFAVAGLIAVPVGDTDVIPPIYVPVAAGQTVKLARIVHVLQTGSGTSVTFDVRLNNVAVTGGAGLVADVTINIDDIADVALADGDKLQIVVTAVSGSPKNLTVGLVLEHTV